jgi:nucleoside-diphosphate-sugar epimerase
VLEYISTIGEEMNVLTIGADGFIGRHVYDELKSSHVVVAGINPNNPSEAYNTSVRIDLRDKNAIDKALASCSPEVVIDCAGVVDPNAGPDDNMNLTKNILEAATDYSGGLRRVILMGSAASYGVLLSPGEVPVSEITPLRAESGYALSKRLEEEYVSDYAKTANIEVIVARLFNPIGNGMKSRFLIPNLIRQIREGELQKVPIEVSRLDSERDYIDVRDAAVAIKRLAETLKLRHNTYNIGSGRATSNEELVSTVMDVMGASLGRLKLIETEPEREKLVASCADISRIQQDTGWAPSITLKETIKAMADEG